MSATTQVQPAQSAPERLADHLRQFGRAIRRKPLGMLSLFIIALVILAALLAPLIAPHDPRTQIGAMSLARPFSQAPDGTLYIFGGDALGRDLFARVVFGARTSLYIGLTSVAIGVVIGAAFGLVSGYLGGWRDTLLQRLMDMTMALPPLILALLINSVLGSQTIYVLIAIAVVWVPTVNRVTRASVLSTKEKAYVQAAHAIGCSPTRVVMRHILPNILAPIVVIGTMMIAQAILLEASLSFLGLGVPPGTPSWGSMITQARDYMTHNPHLLLFPGGALTLTILAFNLVGDYLRDLWDPKLRTL